MSNDEQVLTITADDDAPDQTQSGAASVETGSAETSASSASDESAAPAPDKGSAEQAAKPSTGQTPSNGGNGSEAANYEALTRSFELLKADNAELRKLIGGQQRLMGKWGDRLGHIDKLEREKQQNEAMSKARQAFDLVFDDATAVQNFQDNPREFLGRLRDALHDYILSTPAVAAYENRLAFIEKEYQTSNARRRFNSEAAKTWPDRVGSPEFLQAAWDAMLELSNRTDTDNMSTEDINSYILKRAEQRFGKSASSKPLPKPVVIGAPAPAPPTAKKDNFWDKILKENEDQMGLR